MSEEKIEHSGIVESIEGNIAHVRIERLSACAGCHAKGLCSIDRKKQIIDVACSPNIHVGQAVTITGRLSSGMNAVMLAFLVPLLILLAILIVSIHFFSLSQISAAMISLIGVAVYYIVLYLFRNRLERSFSFHLKQS